MIGGMDDVPAEGRLRQPLPAGYRLSADPGQLDLELVHHWLATDAYWAIGRPADCTRRAFDGSVAVGIYHGGRQVAVARLVTDRATFVWLCDVYVDRAHRGLGLGRCLAGWATDWAGRHGVRKVRLATADAHGVYAAAGFVPLADPGAWMEFVHEPASPASPPT